MTLKFHLFIPFDEKKVLNFRLTYNFICLIWTYGILTIAANTTKQKTIRFKPGKGMMAPKYLLPLCWNTLELEPETLWLFILIYEA